MSRVNWNYVLFPLVVAELFIFLIPIYVHVLPSCSWVCLFCHVVCLFWLWKLRSVDVRWLLFACYGEADVRCAASPYSTHAVAGIGRVWLRWRTQVFVSSRVGLRGCVDSLVPPSSWHYGMALLLDMICAAAALHAALRRIATWICVVVKTWE